MLSSHGRSESAGGTGKPASSDSKDVLVAQRLLSDSELISTLGDVDIAQRVETDEVSGYTAGSRLLFMPDPPRCC